METVASEGRDLVRKLLAKQHHELNQLTRHMQSAIRDELRPETEQKKSKTIKSSPPRHTHVPHRPGLQTNPTQQHHPLSQSSSNTSDGLGNASDGLGGTAAFAFPAPDAGLFLFSEKEKEGVLGSCGLHSRCRTQVFLSMKKKSLIFFFG